VERSGILKDYPGIDGVVAIVHGTGCGHAAYGEGFEVLRRTQWGYASHPNFAGVVMVGLGCEVFQIGRMKQEYGLQETDTFRTMTIQETGGTRKTVEAISSAIRDMIPIAARAKARTRPASEIVPGAAMRRLGRHSALTANPRSARSDLLVRHGRHRRSSRRRRRSTGPSTCSPAAPRRARSARSSSPASAGGRSTPPRTAAR
jgi:altronate hydrolase